MPKETRATALMLASETGADPRTVHKWLTAQPVTPIVDYALRIATRKLGLSLPDHLVEPPSAGAA